MSSDTTYTAELLNDRVEHLRGDIDNIARLVTLQTIRRNLDQLEQSIVADCRTEGLTWDHIGQALDVSRQAAQQRFS